MLLRVPWGRSKSGFFKFVFVTHANSESQELRSQLPRPVVVQKLGSSARRGRRWTPGAPWPCKGRLKVQGVGGCESRRPLGPQPQPVNSGVWAGFPRRTFENYVCENWPYNFRANPLIPLHVPFPAHCEIARESDGRIVRTGGWVWGGWRCGFPKISQTRREIRSRTNQPRQCSLTFHAPARPPQAKPPTCCKVPNMQQVLWGVWGSGAPWVGACGSRKTWAGGTPKGPLP